MARYTPKRGDLARDAYDVVWFIYVDPADPGQLYAIGAEFGAGTGGHRIEDCRRAWGPLRLEHRPTGSVVG